MSFGARTRSRSDPSTLHWRLTAVAALLLAAGPVGCQSSGDEPAARTAPPVVEVSAADYAFAAPDSIRSGWTTFRMRNEGTELHHFHLFRLPPDKSFADYRDALLAPVDSVRSLIADGTIDSARADRAIAQSIADWVGPRALDMQGGVGAVAPGDTGQATVRLPPGTYVMDCGIPTPDGTPHWMLGMVRGLTVTDDSTQAAPPSADATLRASGREIVVDGELTPGPNTLRFVVEAVPEGVPDSSYFAWPVRPNSDATLDEIAAWMNEAQAKGPSTPAPGRFLGGFEYLPARQPAYFTVDLSPGQHGVVWGYLGGSFHTKELLVE